MDAKRDSLYFKFRAFVEGDITDNIPDEWYLYKFIKTTNPMVKIVISRRDCHDIGLVREDGKCAICLFEKHGRIPHVGELSPRQTALRAGQKWYIPDSPCPHCGKVAERHVFNGMCRGCYPSSRRQSDVPSARQIAMSKGEKWYIPETPCKHCGKLEQRYVANGRCKCQNTGYSALKRIEQLELIIAGLTCK